MLESTTSALLESIQIRRQLLLTMKSNPLKENWSDSGTIHKILNYLELCKRLSIEAYPPTFIHYSTGQLLDEMKNILILQKKPLLVANLPCPILGWHSVRVLIPGFTTHQHPSQSLGGDRILNPIFKHVIPS